MTLTDSTVFYEDEHTFIMRADCLVALKGLPDECIDSVVTDPPYGLSNTDPGHVVQALSKWFAGDREFLPGGGGFMGKKWDSFVPPPAVWDECFRVLKPGGHLLCFAGSRTQDLTGLSIRLAGFEIRDSISWLYGSGFPKSLDVSKSIDKSRVSDVAERWQGWGTALKPAQEPIVVARKPIVGTVAANVLAHGTGAMNIDGCRIGDGAGSQGPRPEHEVSATARYTEQGSVNLAATPGPRGGSPSGRWPANVILDESQAESLDAQTGVLKSGKDNKRKKDHQTTSMAGTLSMLDRDEVSYGDAGGASRFFYVAKATKKERPVHEDENGKILHPTVKPLALMRWLVRLVTPPGGTVLDPFVGSGTTVEAAMLEGFRSIAFERDESYLPLIRQRIDRVSEALS